MINIIGLIKRFSNNVIIDNLNLKINRSEITALVGKNGAGKSTLIRLISGLLKTDDGEILMSHDAKIGKLLGGDISLYRNLTAYEIIQYFGKLHGIDSGFIYERIDTLNDILNLKSFTNKRAYAFSRGMRQKIGLTLSVIHDPDILLLDEPQSVWILKHQVMLLILLNI